MSDTLEKFTKAHADLRKLQSSRALRGAGCIQPIGGFTIMWDGIADLAPPFEIRVGGQVRSCNSLERAIAAATEMMEAMIVRASDSNTKAVSEPEAKK